MKKTATKSKPKTPGTGRITIGELRRTDPDSARRMLSKGWRTFCARLELVRLLRGEQNSFGQSCEHLVQDDKLGILADVTSDERSIKLWLAAERIMDEGFQPSKFSVRERVMAEHEDLFPPDTSKATWAKWMRKSQLQKLLDDARGSRDKPLSIAER